ncbi:MAG TPA: arginase family protein [Nitrososphaera sp.]|nr:arginase family protein [Nitrososphaera sp.]
MEGKDLQLSLIGVPTNSAGNGGGVASAPAALRRAGLAKALGRLSDVRDEGDVTFSKPSTRRDSESGIIAHDSLVSMIHNVRASVDGVLQSGRFPLVIGGDCPVLLGCLAACKGIHVGLLFVDGHEDAYPAHKSPTGEAADMELGFALGLEVQEKIQEAVGSPLIDAARVCILGARDKKVLQKMGIRSLDGLVEYHDDAELRAGSIPALTSRVLRRLTSKTGKLWLHIDLDVLSTRSLPAVDYRQPGGLSWKQLEELAKAILSSGNVVGCNVTIYNPDLDPNRRHAKRIVKFLSAVLA